MKPLPIVLGALALVALIVGLLWAGGDRPNVPKDVPVRVLPAPAPRADPPAPLPDGGDDEEHFRPHPDRAGLRYSPTP